MMKCLFFLLVVAATQAYVAKVAEVVPTPVANRLDVFYSSSFQLALELGWIPVQNSANPILGYKVSAFDQGSTLSNDQSNVFKEVIVGADATSAQVEGIQVGVWYLVRVQAFTSTAISEMSPRWWIMLHPETRDGKMMYSLMK